VIGKMVAHYKIIEEIGQGGLGIVHKAEDTKLKRTVALKFLKVTALGSKEQKARFIREAQAEAAILSGLSQEPSQPFLYAMLGLTYKDMGRRDDALLHLRKAMDIWKDADPDFKPAKDPRRALADLESAPSD
jgi:serine/threonine protein kinase